MDEVASERAKRAYREQNGWGTDKDRRECINCGKVLVRAEASNRYPRSGQCPVCITEHKRLYRREFARNWMHNKYMTDDEFRERAKKRERDSSRAKRVAFVSRRLEGQGWKCAACDIPLTIDSKWHRDHDHSCCIRGCDNCWRGILCSPCNKALGFAEENPQRLRSLASYAEKWSTNG